MFATITQKPRRTRQLLYRLHVPALEHHDMISHAKEAGCSPNNLAHKIPGWGGTMLLREHSLGQETQQLAEEVVSDPVRTFHGQQNIGESKGADPGTREQRLC